MNYYLEAGESPKAASQRISREQISFVLSEFSSHAAGHPATIHLGRVTCKRLRALLRLVKPGIRTKFDEQDQTLRIAARQLAGQREARVLLKTFDRFVQKFGSGFSDSLISFISSRLEQDAHNADRTAVGDRISDFENAMKRFLDLSHSCAWKKQAGKSEIILGFTATYAKGRSAMKAVTETKPSPEKLHELRKWVKYHGYQLALLQEFKMRKHSRRVDRVGRLEKMLGNAHDLDALLARVVALEFIDTDPAEVKRLVKSINKRRHKLQSRAVDSAKELYSQRTRCVRKRLGKQLQKYRK